MERRDALKTLAASVAAAVSVPALAEEHDHAAHMHHMGTHSMKNLVDTASTCLTTGEACLAHCLVLLGDGDKEMASCAKSVNAMLPVCTALMKLALQNSSFTPSMARLAADVCAACEKECRKHEKKHAECKACADACAACLKECKALSA